MSNLVNQNYNVLSSNYLVCIDLTLLGKYGELFLVMDIASRCIIGHCYSSVPLDTDTICQVLEEIIRKRSFLPKMKIVHSDRGSVFRNEDFIAFLESKDIEVSRGSSKAHQNQVIERCIRTIKDRVRSVLRPEWSALKKAKGKWDPFEDLGISKEEFQVIISEEISVYNDKPHAHFKKKATPNEMEEALFKEHGKNHPVDQPLMATSISETGKKIELYKSIVLEKFKGDWAQFFISWREAQEQWQEQTKKELQEAKNQYESLFKQYLEVQKKLEEVHQESMRQKKEDEDKQARKLKRQASKKQALRATITVDEFEGILKLIKGRSNLVMSRRRLALAILYLTGLRISNLLVFTVLNGRELFSDGVTTIPLIKGGEQRHKIILTVKGRHFLKDFLSDYEILTATKKGSHFLFSTPKNNELSFNPELFDRELNSILSKASALYEKHLRTHSFRATFITDLLESVQIEDVKEIIGHRNIATTLEYKRSRLSDSETKQLLKGRDEFLKKNENPRKKEEE